MTRICAPFETYHQNQSKAQAWPTALILTIEARTNGTTQLEIPHENKTRGIPSK